MHAEIEKIVIAALGGRRTLGRRRRTLEQLAREGLPRPAFRHAMQILQLKRARQQLLLAASDRTLRRYHEEPGHLEPATADRVLRAVRLYATAVWLFGHENAIAWLHESQQALAERAPVDCWDTDAGMHAIDALLGTLTGVPA